MRKNRRSPPENCLEKLEDQLRVEDLILSSCRVLMELSSADRCSIMVLDTSTDELMVRWAQGIRVKPYGTARFRVGEGLCGWVARAQKPLFSFDMMKERRFIPRQIPSKRFKQVKSIHCLPLVHQGRTVGVVNLSSFSSRSSFRRGGRCLSKVFLDRLAQVIHQAVLLQEAQAISDRWRSIVKNASDSISQVSHEVRTPLAIILESASQLLGGFGGTPTEEQKKRLVIIQRQGDRMLRLANQMLDVSRIEAGRVSLYRKPVRLAEIIEDIRRRYEPLIAPRQVFLEMGDAPTVYGDPVRLGQVVENLLINAVKFTPPEGAIRISLEARGRSVEMAVADTGVGIDKKEQRRLFDKFFQPKIPTNLSLRGTGFGLILVKDIVQMHGGTVRLDSEHDRGTRFIISLPMYTPIFALTEEFRLLREQAAREGLSLVCQLFDIDSGPLVLWQEVRELLQKHVSKEDRVLINPDGGLVVLAVMERDGLQPMRQRLEQVLCDHPELLSPSSVRWGWAWVPEEANELPALLGLAKSRMRGDFSLAKGFLV